MKNFLRFLLGQLYDFRVYNENVLETPGPVLLLPNHVSWFDWLLLLSCLTEEWRFVTSSRTAQTTLFHRYLMLNDRTFPIDTNSPYAVKRMAEYLQQKGRLVLFPEGRLSRTGTLMKLFDGTGFLLHKTEARVITCYLRGAHRLPFSPNKDVKKLLPRVSAHFSDVLTPPKLEGLSTAQSRTRLTAWLRERMLSQQFETEMKFGPRVLETAIMDAARLRPRHIVLEDLNGKLTFKRLTLGAALLAEQLQTILRASSRVGVLLPNVNATPVLLLALWSLGKVPSLLNYSTGSAIMLACIQLAGLEQVITSRAFLERAKLKIEPLTEAGVQLIFLEDIRQGISSLRKLKGLLGLTRVTESPFRDPQFPAVVLFTSGSEGIPKGVELTHANLLANVRQMLSVMDLQDHDRIFNALPLFHSFGLTVGTLLGLVRGMFVFLYPSPLHYRVVPTVFYHTDSTVMLGTNTFLNGYARKAHPLDFRSLRYMISAAEKLQETTATTWARRFGVRILEGYGATECSPCVSVNTPMDPRYGSAGRVVPGMEYMLKPVEGVHEAGRLFVRGPNVMRGYLNAEANAQFQALGGWYDTGDIVKIDSDGFLFVQGRLKRFAKISGEMVSLTAVEEALAGAFPHYGLRCQVAVVARPDEDKGEVLVAISNEPKLKLDEVRSAIKAKGLPNLCNPRQIRFLHEIPKLGTGKINHRELEKLIASED